MWGFLSFYLFSFLLKPISLSIGLKYSALIQTWGPFNNICSYTCILKLHVYIGSNHSVFRFNKINVTIRSHWSYFHSAMYSSSIYKQCPRIQTTTAYTCYSMHIPHCVYFNAVYDTVCYSMQYTVTHAKSRYADFQVFKNLPKNVMDFNIKS